MIKQLYILLFIITSCSADKGANLAGGSSAQRNSDEAYMAEEDDDFAQVPSAVAGGIYLVCQDDPELENNTMGCAAQDKSGQKHELSDEIAETVTVVAKSYRGIETPLVKADADSKWSWLGNLEARAATYSFEFDGRYKGKDIKHIIAADKEALKLSCEDIGGKFFEGMCLKVSGENKSCTDACNDLGVNLQNLIKINSPQECSKAWGNFKNNPPKPDEFKVRPGWMRPGQAIIRFGCSEIVKDVLGGMDGQPLDKGYYWTPGDQKPSPSVDTLYMKRMCTCNM